MSELCKCGANVGEGDEHTGNCQLDHFVSYTGDGQYGFDSKELMRIVANIEIEAVNRSNNQSKVNQVEEMLTLQCDMLSATQPEDTIRLVAIANSLLEIALQNRNMAINAVSEE